MGKIKESVHPGCRRERRTQGHQEHHQAPRDRRDLAPQGLQETQGSPEPQDSLGRTERTPRWT